mgnify:CR=1 FL=1
MSFPWDAYGLTIADVYWQTEGGGECVTRGLLKDVNQDVVTVEITIPREKVRLIASVKKGPAQAAGNSGSWIDTPRTTPAKFAHDGG